MEYYYDILLNFNEYYFMFYEWESDDCIEGIKKIPIKHVDSKAIIDLISNKVKVTKEFLKQIKDKTKLKNNKVLQYTCIFSDGKNSVAIEFNEEGISINKSSLLLDDEININEFIYNVNLINLDYIIIDKDLKNTETRQDLKIKRIIKLEIMNMYKEKNYSKIKYIYLEWFNKLNDNIEEMKEEMLQKLNDNLTNKEYRIYELIKMSYNNV